VLAGVAVLARVDWHTFRIGRGETEILLAAVFFSLLLSCINWPPFGTNRAERTSAAMFLIEAGLFAAVSLVTCRDAANLVAPYLSIPWVGLAVLAALLGTAGPFILINRYQRFVSPNEAGLIYCFSPVIAALAEIVAPAPLSRWLGFEYANQPLTTALVIGGALILAANILIQLQPARRE
jgi:drug/metabolite transporter (DMT)-like permease